jgi:outer membrane usher protein
MIDRCTIRQATRLRRLVAGPFLLTMAFTALPWAVSPVHASSSSTTAVNLKGPADAPDEPVDTNANAAVADVQFDRSLLSGAGSNTTDLARFEHGNLVNPGNYNVDIYLNTTWVGRSDVRFANATGQPSAKACVDAHLLDQTNLHPAKPTVELSARLADPGACVAMADVIPDATTTFDTGELRLDVGVPQAYMGQVIRGYVDPKNWDVGVPAGLLNYNFNSYHSSSRGLNQTSSYLGLRAGLNLGPWHFRHDSTVDWQSATPGGSARHRWQNIDSYVRRNIPALRAQLTIGDSFTDGQVFDSFGLRGVQLATDDRMLPESIRGYAPVVRGVADTNARVTIRQNGIEIYQTTVAPGPFTLSDLYPTGYGGNLDVTVTEADGRSRAYSVPYGSVAQLLRPGSTRFSLAVGQLRNLSLIHLPDVAQAAIQHGFNNMLTGYAGIEVSKGFGALLVGSALNTRYGAFAVDITQSHANVQGYSTHSGQSMRLSYSKILPQTNTSLTVAAYRHSTSGYLSLSDAALARDYARRGIDAFDQAPYTAPTLISGVPLQTVLTPAQQAALNGSINTQAAYIYRLQRERNRFDLTLNQRIGASGGSLYANASVRDYWSHANTDTQFQMGYTNSFHRVSYSISATRSTDFAGRYGNQYNLTINVPLGNGLHTPTLALNLGRRQDGGMQEQASASGAYGADNQLNYGITANHSGSGQNDLRGSTSGTSGSLTGGYRSPYAVLNASYGRGSNYSQASVGIGGAIVAHRGGVTLGQPISDTIAVVRAPHAAGARLINSPGARIDRFGYALVPYLTPYNLNTIQIDPKKLPLDVELEATSAQVTPHAGAVVMVTFKTKIGRTIIVQLKRDNGQPVPFGAEAFSAGSLSLGVVGQYGKALLRGVNRSGPIEVRWHDATGSAQSCSFPYQMLEQHRRANSNAYQMIDAICTAASMSAGSGA